MRCNESEFETDVPELLQEELDDPVAILNFDSPLPSTPKRRKATPIEPPAPVALPSPVTRYVTRRATAATAVQPIPAVVPVAPPLRLQDIPLPLEPTGLQNRALHAGSIL